MLKHIKDFSGQIICGVVVTFVAAIIGSVIGLDKIIEWVNPPVVIPDGYWDGSFTENGKTILSTLFIASKGDKIEGTMIENRGSLENPKKVKSTLDGKINRNELSFAKKYPTKSGQDLTTEYVGKFLSGGKTAQGICKNSLGTGTFKFTKNE